MRISSAARRTALACADRFDCLPPGITRFHLIDALEIARAHFALSDAELLYLRLAIRSTADRLWARGQEPIFGWARIDIARVLCKSDRSIHRIEASLVAKGLIVHRDGPACRRHSPSAQSRGAGVSLAPCAARAAEILAAQKASLAEGRAWYRARKRLFVLRRALAGIARDRDLPETLRHALATRLADVPERLDAAMSQAMIACWIDSLSALLSKVRAFHAATEMTAGEDKNVLPSYSPDSLFPDHPAHRPELPDQGMEEPRVPGSGRPGTGRTQPGLPGTGLQAPGLQGPEWPARTPKRPDPTLPDPPDRARADPTQAEGAVTLALEAGLPMEVLLASVRSLGLDTAHQQVKQLHARMARQHQAGPIRAPVAYFRALCKRAQGSPGTGTPRTGTPRTGPPHPLSLP